MSIEIPDNWLGKKLDGSLEKILQKPKSIASPIPAVQTVITPAGNNGINRAEYIILSGRKHDSYEYGDTLVAIERTHHDNDWHGARDELKKEGAYMLTIRQFADFLTLLRSGHAFDGNGNTMSPSRLNDIYNDITEVRNPWRSEWLDAKFTEQQTVPRSKVVGVPVPFTGKTGMHIAYHTVDARGVLKEVNEPLDAYLDKNKTPGIDLDNWLQGATKHGIPSPNITGGKLYYWQPTDGRVARFVAGSDRAGLNCGRDPADRNPNLGVRAARLKI